MRNNNTEPGNTLYKICVVGEPSTGKTSLLNRYLNDKFTKQHVQTVHIVSQKKDLNISQSSTDSSKVEFFEIPALRRNPPIYPVTQENFDTSHAFIIVYDATASGTLERTDEWLKVIPASQQKPIFIVGNKVDECTEQTEAEQQLKDYADKHPNRNIIIIDQPLISAKENENIDELFEAVLTQCHKTYGNKQSTANNFARLKAPTTETTETTPLLNTDDTGCKCTTL